MSEDSNSDQPLSVSSALRDLEDTLKIFYREVEVLRKPRENELKHLLDAVESLARPRAVVVLHTRPDSRQRWNDYCSGRARFLSSADIRHLCWEPQIASSMAFIRFLLARAEPINAHKIIGLVHSYHFLWSHDSTRDYAQTIGLILKRYQGRNRLVARWRSFPDNLLGNTAPEQMAHELVKNCCSLSDFCTDWGLDSATPFFCTLMTHAADECRKGIGRSPVLCKYLLNEILSWRGWPMGVFKTEVEATILDSAAESDADVQDSIKRFAIDNEWLGDPRLPRNRINWAGISRAETRVLSWMAKADIVFFFEHVLPRHSDPHGRKTFWLGYVSRLKRSRPLLCWEDKNRLQSFLKSNRAEAAAYGSTDLDTSAFLLDFGPILVVEFAKSGNACYIYEKDSVKPLLVDFWRHKTFTLSELKNLNARPERITHLVRKRNWQQGWDEKLAGILATFGIRPFPA
jgi:EH_Signature domain